MTSAKILVAEDESITAKDIAETLKSQGYDVPAIASSGEEAIQKAEAIRPDLVLMDIVLKGNVDGIAAARQIRDRFDIPVVYLTAYADSEIVKRAKITEPFGYIIKPFEARELRSNIEMALYKHKAEKALRQAEQEKAVVLGSMSELVIHQDLAHKVIWANRAAAESVGLSAKELVGRHCFEIWQGRDKPCVGCPVVKARETGRLQTAEMVSPDGRIWSIRGYPVKDVKGAVTGVVEVTENITDRKKAEKKLRESEARYRILFEQSPLGIGLATPDGRVAHVNKTMEVITGYFKEELKKINLDDTYENPQDRKKLLETIERYGCAVDFPVRKKRKDGTVYDALLNVSRVRFGDRDFFQTICMDVTERKKAQEALRESEEKYRDIFENAREAIVTIDLKGRISNANKIFEEYGFKREELIGKSQFDFVPEYDKASAISDFETLIAGNPLKGEMDVITPKGVIKVEYSDNPIEKDGEIIGVQAILTDITDRKRAEEALRESEERFRGLYENALLGLYRTTPDGRILMANPALIRMLRYSNFEELAERNLEENGFESGHPRLVFKERIEKEGQVVGLESAWTRRDGTSLYVRESAKAIRDEQGNTLYYEGTVEDITERKQAEEQIAKLAKFPAEDPNPVLRISKDCIILYANRASSVALETWGKKVGERLPQDYCNRIEEALGSGRASTFEFVCHDGRIFKVTLAPVVESGYVNVYGLDITEHKQAMEQIEKLARFPAEDPNPVLRVSGYGTVVYGNKSSEPLLKLWRCRVGGSLSGKWYDLVLDALSCGQNQQIEVKCGEQTFSLVVAPIMDSNYVNVYGRDITERKKAEDVVRESHDYLVRLTDSMWDVVFSVKMPERVIEWVNSSCRFIGYEPEECVGKTTEFLYPGKSEFLDFGKKLTEAIETGEDVLHAEQLLGRKNGEIFPAEITTTLFKAKGKVVRITSIVKNITERKKSEQKVLEHQDKLRSMASELSLAEERERRHIAEGLHDDIIQPLAFLDIKLDSLKNSVRERGLTESCNQMQETIRELIRITRAFTFDLSSPVLYELGLEAAVEEWLAANIREKYGIETVFEDDDRSKPLDDDMRAFLFKAVKELLINVIKHAKASNVKVSIARDTNKINIRVEDNGTGFHPDREKDRFFHFSGYGLFSIRERLNYMRGSFNIESKPGQGTRVTLTAPLKPETISEKGNDNEH